MEAQTREENSLTCKTDHLTMCAVAKALAKMDETIKRIVDRYHEIQRDIRMLQREAQSLRDTLGSIGYKPDYFPVLDGKDQDEIYARDRPFLESTLVNACRKVLQDNAGGWLTKAQTEYLVSMGGYRFSTKDRKNSVDMTLRRLVSKGLCEVKTDPQGNLYRWVEKSQ